MDTDRAKRIADTLSTPGWQDIEAIRSGMAEEYRQDLYHMISTTPDKLTGKAAVRLASKAKALEEFRESVEDELKVLAPRPKGRGE